MLGAKPFMPGTERCLGSPLSKPKASNIPAPNSSGKAWYRHYRSCYEAKGYALPPDVTHNEPVPANVARGWHRFEGWLKHGRKQ